MWGWLLKAVPGMDILPDWAWKAIFGLVAIVAFAFYWDLHGASRVQARWDQERATMTMRSTVFIKGATEWRTHVQVEYQDKERIIYVQGKTIKEKVTEYVTKPDDSACTINNGFVRVWDASVRGEPPGPPADSDRAPSGVALSTVSETATDNHTIARAARNKLDACIDFYRGLQRKAKEANELKAP